MIKPIVLLALLTCFFTLRVGAQNANHDSITVAVAKQDAKYFHLNSIDFKKFKQDRHNYTSDYFKPTKAVVNDNALLADSVYVKAYRQFAWEKTRYRRSVGHYLLLGYAAFGVVLAMAYATTPGKH